MQFSAKLPERAHQRIRVVSQICAVFCLATVLSGSFVLYLVGPVTAAVRPSEGAWYMVRRGDNLTVIGRRYGVSVGDLRGDNKLSSDTIHIDQKLNMRHPFRLTDFRQIKWARPFTRKGNILRTFGPYKSDKLLMPRTGTDMAYPRGGTVNCPANGVIRHIGAMDGYGTLVIIEHGAGSSTVLAPLRPESIKWQEDQAVHRGDKIGVTAEPVVTGEAYLHIELRKNDKAVKPDRLLK